MTDEHTLTDLKNLSPSEIDRFCIEQLHQKPGQGTRVAVRLFRNKIEEIDEMTELNRPFRELLKNYSKITRLTIARRIDSEDGTEKLLYSLDDGRTVEGVLIPGPARLTLCVSTQVGCASGCAFCRTGRSGLIRNLTPAEIVNQVFAAQKIARLPITNIVLMGTGEPLGNYNAVKTFVRTITDRNGMGLSSRKVTISTCGLADAIERMADEKETDASLAVSLNAVTDEVRDKIMPVNKRFPLPRLLHALRYYASKTGKTITIEYVLFKGINDSDEDALQMTSLLKGLPCMINLLMFNSHPGAIFTRPDEERVFAFRNLLLRHGYVAVVRNSRGKDINAACGQLSSTYEQPSSSNA